ncbi:biotin synthase BioB [Methylobacterium nodulans]|uniref:Biotin synthase n=1 Tax=Methylobacterium nodulans (strain LMG 21967 / CNCM I-2342 / ORS 2060) TaxID=460265 RepID=BIOB_METNO|nr:biotin synthase BioB [Methylobacterium nodulans]B8IU36.1 RecName: Full=Biotin synthase [Methylobacterium nodulans ORS 2060]ACL60894.1 biotin synthase [Methylobacterium nodulans ORS 2060]
MTTTTERPDAPIRHDWTVAEIQAIYDLPLLDLVHRASLVHRAHHDPADIQRASLLSIKTGGCPEDCAYCPQSAHHKEAGIGRQRLMPVEAVLREAEAAKAAGATRFCMGAAWRQPKDGPEFDAVLAMVRGVRGLGMEACVTLGMLTPSQAERLAEAGLTAYNHNLDTGPDFYGDIISTRTYADRLNTLQAVRDAGIGVCCGGIIGMGEGVADRAAMLQVLANHAPHPESVPINALVAVAGTPLAERPPVDPLDLVRMCATARIVMPKARVRLSAGRRALTREAQVLCFLAGANSIFYGERLLTTANNEADADAQLLRDIGVPVPGIEVLEAAE